MMTGRELRRIKKQAEAARRVWESQPCPLAVVEVAKLVPKLVAEIERLKDDEVKVDDIQDLYW